MTTRTETDTFGPIDVPSDRYWGAQAQRSLGNFRIGWERQPASIVRALGIVKQAAALVNVRLLAAVDTAFGTLSGPATVHVLRRALDRYDDRRFERLARLSVSHLYNLRASRTYERQRVIRTATRASANPIGTRRAPAPAGRAGFIRIDSVHQGDLDGARGCTTSTR